MLRVANLAAWRGLAQQYPQLLQVLGQGAAPGHAAYLISIAKELIQYCWMTGSSGSWLPQVGNSDEVLVLS